MQKQINILKRMRFLGIIIIFLALHQGSINAQKVNCGAVERKNHQILFLENELIGCKIMIKDSKLVADSLEMFIENPDSGHPGRWSIRTNADFRLDLVWTGWRAPGKKNNADNRIGLSKQDFYVTGYEFNRISGDTDRLDIFLKGNNNPFIITLSYQLKAGSYYLKRRLEVKDTISGKHFLQKIFPVYAEINGIEKVIKEGGFGQPVACLTEAGGAFFGVEYPTAENYLEVLENNSSYLLKCKQFVGSKITNEGRLSEWVVYGMSPDHAVKKEFMSYLDDIRVAPLKPYTLYNSWYDLRSTEYPGVPQEHHMNEQNVLRIIELIRENMINKHHIHLDAFVLDDGWDIYESDWKMRKDEFPNSLKPIADELAKTGTDLGIWFGPTGGYSFRSERINWMKEHGYEIVGDETKYHNAMLCLAGKNYSKLFRKRVTDLVKNDGVKYFKWDGIQFTCSESDHGHPIGIYSRNAVMESVIDKCNAVREIDPDIYLNITSGTWLSPWWIKYANQIWMDAYDYGLASVPSFSKRDAAITYRDLSLYEDFFIKDLWFPIANLMTHGIIKGNLQKLGGEDEPIDKFTDNALLYFARGVSMWELYISPDILSDEEWNAIARSIHWAGNRFDILSNTEMIGGNPGERQCYGYVHFKDNRGIVALRNPSVNPNPITFTLSGEYGLNKNADSLVLEQVYPIHRISTELYAEGSSVKIPLQGYETAVFEIYPLKKTNEPLLAGVTFDVIEDKRNTRKIEICQTSGHEKLLNPDKVRGIKIEGIPIQLNDLSIKFPGTKDLVFNKEITFEKRKQKALLNINLNIHESSFNSTIGILLTPSTKREFNTDNIKLLVDKQYRNPSIRKQQGKWIWITNPVGPGEHRITIELEDPEQWHGQAGIWLFGQQNRDGREILFECTDDLPYRPMPPRPLPQGIFKVNSHLGNIEIP